MTTVVILSTPGAGTWTVPADWNNHNNTIHCIGCGAPGGGGGDGGGGGGGAWASGINVSLTPKASIAYQVGQNNASAAIRATFFNGTEGSGSNTVEAGGGNPSNGSGSGGAGGIPVNTSGGGNGFNGGSGGNLSGQSGGGGGAGGPNGVGRNGNNGNVSSGAGGNGDFGFGGAGGAGGTGINNGSPGGNGVEIAGGIGSGGGGGASTNEVGGSGGLYGGGGGGSGNQPGAGANGVIIIVYSALPPVHQGYPDFPARRDAKVGIGAWLQSFFFGPPRLLPKPNITGTMSARSVETNDSAEFGVQVYTPEPTPPSLQGANVSIYEVPAIAGGNVSIKD